MLRTLLLPASLLVAVLAAAQQEQPPAQPTPAQPPASATAQTNPVKPTPEGLAHAKKVWGYDCALCHGDKGDGKGDVAASMNLTLKDYTKPDSLKDMTDGQIFDIIKNGKGQMPPETGRAKPDDIWNLVTLIRNMSKKTD
ncbi:cytochrome c [Alloacidobacterium sp.]|uniref:c-type cytochrome n=1 Tax=Alloacidobacterium sp. TaxID=2951999 RepID=UPI002D2D6FB0|nr:cytochrome c [Alloacidobacterium sp.]HYK38105.1 cytochrome c [Alloacidobacterium sp.]